MLPVSDARSNAPEQIEHVVSVLGRSRRRLEVFTCIYAGKKQAKSVNEISQKTGLDSKIVLTEGKLLADNQIVRQLRIMGGTAYQKDSFINAHKKRIMRFVNKPHLLLGYPTKRRPKHITSSTIKIVLPRNAVDVRELTVDDIQSFSKVSKVRSAKQAIISEKTFKLGIARIIGESGEYHDWGGEKNDLWSTRLVVAGRRQPTAFAFKGPGTRGTLTPKKMGKNGDQIQRLFASEARVFIIQYWDEIGESVFEQMAAFARAKSATESRRICYGIIDGRDTARIIAAYHDKFD